MYISSLALSSLYFFVFVYHNVYVFHNFTRYIVVVIVVVYLISNMDWYIHCIQYEYIQYQKYIDISNVSSVSVHEYIYLVSKIHVSDIKYVMYSMYMYIDTYLEKEDIVIQIYVSIHKYMYLV